MARRRNFRYTDYLRCPRCGAILVYLTARVRDRHSPDGWAERKAPVTMKVKNRVSQDDRADSEVVVDGRRGQREGEMRTFYWHNVDVCCSRMGCTWAGSSKDERVVRRTCPDSELPGDFWIGE